MQIATRPFPATHGPADEPAQAEVIALNILSAGAAQSVVEETTVRVTVDEGCKVHAAFGAVGAMKARLLAGEPADVIILTAALIEELAASGHVVPASQCDLGTVGTGVAVR